VPRASALTPD